VALVRLFQRLARAQRVVSVLHDLSLALQANWLVVMRQGRIAAEGAHDDPRVHDALESVFDHAVRVQRVGNRFLTLPNLDD
jgi:iron complex transport system ATP-binding protein